MQQKNTDLFMFNFCEEHLDSKRIRVNKNGVSKIIHYVDSTSTTKTKHNAKLSI